MIEAVMNVFDDLYKIKNTRPTRFNMWLDQIDVLFFNKTSKRVFQHKENAEFEGEVYIFFLDVKKLEKSEWCHEKSGSCKRNYLWDYINTKAIGALHLINTSNNTTKAHSYTLELVWSAKIGRQILKKQRY